MPGLTRITPFRFGAADSSASAHSRALYRDNAEALHGPFTDAGWLEHGTMVSYHDMVRRIAEELDLTGVDLVITVDSSPDCRHQSAPGCVLAEAVGTGPVMFGVSEQGVAGPFTALRIAHDRLVAGRSDRALVVLLEQRTLPAEPGVPQPVHDIAVAMVVERDGALALTRPVITPHGAQVRGALPVPDGHVCVGAWLALADFVASGGHGDVVVADRDPVLGYACSVTLSVRALAAVA